MAYTGLSLLLLTWIAIANPSLVLCLMWTRHSGYVKDILNGKAQLPFLNRKARNTIQSECADLRRTHAHLSQGTCPSEKLTDIHDVKQYLNVASIARDGLLVVHKDEPFS